MHSQILHLHYYNHRLRQLVTLRTLRHHLEIQVHQCLNHSPNNNPSLSLCLYSGIGGPRYWILVVSP